MPRSPKPSIIASISKRGYRTRTLLCVPLQTRSGERFGVFELINKLSGTFTQEDQEALVELAAHAAVALENAQDRQKLMATNRQIADQAAEGVRLIGECPAIQSLRSIIRRVAETDLAVLIGGENGTGKEVVAQSIHYLSRRRGQPFIALNCAAIPDTLAESELFGHEKGAFTDAHESRPGKFELASGGTLFLDEIGDLSLNCQAKLLRVLEEKVMVRVGGSAPIPTDARVLGRHQSEVGRDGPAEAVSRGPLFPLERGDARSAAAAPAGGRHPAPGRPFPRRFLPPCPSQAARAFRRRPQAVGRASLAGQCPRVAEPDGAAGLSHRRRSRSRPRTWRLSFRRAGPPR